MILLYTSPITHCIFSIFIYMYSWDVHSFKEYKHCLIFSLFTLLISVVLLLKIPEYFYQQNGFCSSISLKSFFKCVISVLVVDPDCVTAVSVPLQGTTFTLCYPQPNTMMVKWWLKAFEKWQYQAAACSIFQYICHFLNLFWS